MASFRKSKEKVFDESKRGSLGKVRSVSLDNIHIIASKPEKPVHSTLSVSPSGLSLKGLKKRFGIKISKSNQDGLEAVAEGKKHSSATLSPERTLMTTSSQTGHSRKEDRLKSMPKDGKQKRKTSEGAQSFLQHSSNDQLSGKLGVPDSALPRPRSMTEASDQFILVDASSMDESLDGTGSAYDTGDDVDGYLPIPADTESKQEIEKLKRKIAKTKELLIELQTQRDESVKEYLQCAEQEAGNPKTKINFEKRNQRTNQSIQSLQRRLEKYQRMLKDEDISPSAHGPKGMLRGMHDAVKAGASTISGKVTKPLGSFNHFIKKEKKGGSLETLPTTVVDSCSSINQDDVEKASHHVYASDEENSSSDSVPHLYPPSSPMASGFNDSDSAKDFVHFRERLERIDPLVEQSKVLINTVRKLEERVEFLSRSLQDERFQSERLQCQLNDLINQWNDLTELHQNEIRALQMELDRAEERIECVDYRSAERAGEIEEAVDSCVTRINKMELQQQQQQQLLLSVDTYFDGSGNAKLLLSKALSLVISVFAILLVLCSTAMRVVTPFLSTRLRFLVTLVVVISVVMICRHANDPGIQEWLRRVSDILEPLASRLPLSWRGHDGIAVSDGS